METLFEYTKHNLKNFGGDISFSNLGSMFVVKIDAPRDIMSQVADDFIYRYPEAYNLTDTQKLTVVDKAYSGIGEIRTPLSRAFTNFKSQCSKWTIEG